MSTTHPKFNLNGVRIHDLQNMTVYFMLLRHYSNHSVISELLTCPCNAPFMFNSTDNYCFRKIIMRSTEEKIESCKHNLSVRLMFTNSPPKIIHQRHGFQSAKRNIKNRLCQRYRKTVLLFLPRRLICIWSQTPEVFYLVLNVKERCCPIFMFDR